jgi:DNA polymerase I-like protein with 3'-5' exonuclease and polymerase domains
MNIITTREQLDEFVSFYRKVDAFAFDVETIGENRLYPVINDVCWISFATEGRTDVIPMGHPNGEFEGYKKPLLLEGRRRLADGKPILESHYSKDQSKWEPQFGEAPSQLTPAEVFAAIKPLLFSDQLKVAHNAKFDLKSVAKYYQGKVPSKPYFDTMTAAFIINNVASKNSLKLKDCVKRELGVDMEKGIGENVALHSFSDVANYSGIDSQLTWELYKKLDAKITGNLKKVWKLEMDVLAALCDMELAGAYIDTAQLGVLAVQIERDREIAKGKAFAAAGEAFAINSVQVKQKLLFTPQGTNAKPRLVPNTKFKGVLTAKGFEAKKSGEELNPSHYSVGAEALEFFRGKDALVDALLEYADLNKLMTTYVTPYTGGMVERETNGKKTLVEKKSLLINGRVHTNFKAHGAETGRFSSSEPNLQNIPSSGEYGKLVRNLFVAPPGHKLVVADYSQIEPRVIASFSGDPRLIDNYVNGGDIYTTIGDTMGVDRKAGKVLVLAISYGVGPDKIASSIGCSLKEAKDLLNRFEAEFPSITKYKARVIRAARDKSPFPYVETLFGRRRYIPELRLSAPNKKFNEMTEDDKKLMGTISRAERQAFNTMIQGSAADIMKLALVRAHSCFVDEPSVSVILTVHDELVTICPEEYADVVADSIRQSMEGIQLQGIKVPLKAEVYIVDKWGEAK